MQAIAVSFVGALVLVNAPGVASAASGFQKASKADTQRLYKALGADSPTFWKTVPMECISARKAKSSKNWFVVQIYTKAPNGRDCRQWAADFQSLVVIRNGQAVDVAGGSALQFTSCTNMRKQIVQVQKGPQSVFRDIRAAGYCSPS